MYCCLNKSGLSEQSYLCVLPNNVLLVNNRAPQGDAKLQVSRYFLLKHQTNGEEEGYTASVCEWGAS